MKQTDIPIWERYTLTIEEASKYFRIGENKLRRPNTVVINNQKVWLLHLNISNREK